jgi:hypothetical protein
MWQYRSSPVRMKHSLYAATRCRPSMSTSAPVASPSSSTSVQTQIGSSFLLARRVRRNVSTWLADMRPARWLKRVSSVMFWGCRVMRFGLGMSCVFHAGMIDVMNEEDDFFILRCGLIPSHRSTRANARIKACAVGPPQRQSRGASSPAHAVVSFE